jgi:hypothetical protein
MPKLSWPSSANDRLNGAPQLSAGTALTNSTAETIISQSPDISFNPNELYQGKMLRVTAYGEFTTPASPNTMQLRLRYGGTGGVALLDTTAVTPIASASHAPFSVEALITVRSEGSSGTAMAMGRALGLTAVNSVAVLPASVGAAATIDTTTAKSITLTGQWGAAASTYSVTVHEFLVEEIN